MRTLIIGMGEIGNALYAILSKQYEVHCFDINGRWPIVPEGIEVMHICIPFVENYIAVVRRYMDQYNPVIVNICTTVPPGTCRAIGWNVNHSTTRGLHPNLVRGLQNIRKHVAGLNSKELAEYFEAAEVFCVTHSQPETTEVAHVLLNIEYGINLMFADEMARVCRYYGVDYMESVLAYRRTHNAGFSAIDHASKQRPLLTPPGGRIGGHCVTQNAEMMSPILEDAKVSAPLIKLLSEYNK